MTDTISHPLRVVFMGSPQFAVPSLQLLVQNPEITKVVGVVSQPDKPAGRGRKLKKSDIAAAAEELGIPVITPTKLKSPEATQTITEWKPDIIIVAAYGRILRKNLLNLPPLGCINVHASLLPRHRGASPIAHAILMGDEKAGVAIMQMEKGLDTGPVFSMSSIPVATDDTALSLSEKLAVLGAELLLETLPKIATDNLQPKPQSDEGMTYASLLEKNDGLLDLNAEALQAERKVRGMYPWPGAFLVRNDLRIQISQAQEVSEASGKPGEVLEANKHGVLVAFAKG
ncbi:methionyl-tRNA formyltransferase, partial [Myxococcota bacterium]|nr:methionyl-tRNA formyltransferase [Myxococcota bacterium]